MRNFIYLIFFIFICSSSNSNNLLIYNFQSHNFYEGNLKDKKIDIEKKQFFFLEKSKKINDNIFINSILIYEQTNFHDGDFMFKDFIFKFADREYSFFKLNNNKQFIEKSLIQKDQIINYINFPYLHSDKIIKPLYLILLTNESFENKYNLFKKIILPFIFLFCLYFLFSSFVSFLMYIVSFLRRKNV